MELTPTAYDATLEINGKKIYCSLIRNIIGAFEIQATSFRTDSSNLSLMDIANFIKILCTEHEEELSSKYFIRLCFSEKNIYSFYAKDVSKQSVEEVLQQIAEEIPFDLFCRLNSTCNCE